MPQLDISTYLGQVFWLFISFGALCIFMQYWFFPRIKSLFQIRQDKTDYLILQAQNLRDQTVEIENRYMAELDDFHVKLKQISYETENFCKKHSDSSMKLLEKVLTKKKSDLIEFLEEWKKSVGKDMEEISLTLSETALASILDSSSEVKREVRKVSLLKYYNKIKDE
jgi:F-type H+-transporting ATPase subunit b